jgi:hypothetical protein
MNKHTPGPWIFGVEEWDYDASRRKPVAKPFDYSGPGYYDNPSIFGADGNEIVGCDQYMVFRNPADIRLLVAAPELLSVCKELAASAAYWSDYDVPLGIVDRLNAAIAKAEGKA